MAKRQPWYTIKKLCWDLQKRGLSVSIISSEKQLPKGFSGTLIKTFSLKDILYFRKLYSYRFIFLVTFPIYPLKKFFTFSPRVFLKNWVDLKRIFMLSLVPMSFILRTLKQSDDVITISDRSEYYLSQYINTIPYVPFIKGNWGGANKQLDRSSHSTSKGCSHSLRTIGYFGPLYTTRCFDQVINFFSWLNANKVATKQKLITRTDRKSLITEEEKLLKNVKKFKSCEVISGFLSREELLLHLSTIDVLILPFRIVMSEFPIVVIEALELGLAVVTSEDSGVSKLCSDTKNCLVLDSFSKKNYPKILEFIDNFNKTDFHDIQIEINKINSEAISKICQS